MPARQSGGRERITADSSPGSACAREARPPCSILRLDHHAVPPPSVAACVADVIPLDTGGLGRRRSGREVPMMRLSGAILALTLLLGTPGRAAASSPLGAFCGTAAQRHPRTYAHVVWIWLENHSYVQIIGSTAAPFINALAT